MKLLTGGDYNKARLAGIMHEMFVSKTDKIPPLTNITQYGGGQIARVNGEYGLILDENSVYFDYLPQVHKNRLIEVPDSWLEGEGD